MLIKLAWRNVFRNKRRTLLSGLAIGIGLASLIVADGVILGMEQSMISMATDTLLGQGQIHEKDFRKTLEVERVINDYPAVAAALEKEPTIRSFSPRTLSYAMLTSPANVESIILYGIEPEKERTITKISDAILKGSFLSSADPQKIVIGSKLADNLEVEVGDRLVVTLAQADTGDLSQAMFRVGGIYHFNMRDLDNGIAFITISKAQELLGLPGKVHEIAFHFKDISLSRNKSLPFWTTFSTNGNVAEGWMDIMPELESLLQLSQFAVYITAIILFGVVSLGIMNTLFMSLYERMFEFGVLRAIGTRPLKMASMIIFEAGAISIISIIIGITLGYILMLYLGWSGIDYEGLEFGGLAFRDKLFPVQALSQYILYPSMLFVFTLIIGTYPAIYAARLRPAKAMRKSF